MKNFIVTCVNVKEKEPETSIFYTKAKTKYGALYSVVSNMTNLEEVEPDFAPTVKGLKDYVYECSDQIMDVFEFSPSKNFLLEII